MNAIVPPLHLYLVDVDKRDTPLSARITDIRAENPTQALEFAKDDAGWPDWAGPRMKGCRAMVWDISPISEDDPAACPIH